MRHAWIFEVLQDLRSYALKNGLPSLAAKAEETLRVAEVEIAAMSRDGEGGGSVPPSGRPH